ncbi:MAG TPA: hypothetical protein VGH48_07300 [Caldimonas sp.]
MLLAYNGLSETEMWLAKVACVSAPGVAFPCSYDWARDQRRVHLASAATLFIVLACFCGTFMRRAKAKGNREAQ